MIFLLTIYREKRQFRRRWWCDLYWYCLWESRIRFGSHAHLAQNVLQLSPIDGFVFAQFLGDAIKRSAIGGYQLYRLRIGGAHDAIYFIIDEFRRCFAIIGWR